MRRVRISVSSRWTGPKLAGPVKPVSRQTPEANGRHDTRLLINRMNWDDDVLTSVKRFTTSHTSPYSVREVRPWVVYGQVWVWHGKVKQVSCRLNVDRKAYQPQSVKSLLALPSVNQSISIFSAAQSSSPSVQPSESYKTSGCAVRWPLRHRDYRKNQAFPLMKCIRIDDMCRIERLIIILVLVWRKSIHIWRRYERKTIFTFSFPVTFDL